MFFTEAKTREELEHEGITFDQSLPQPFFDRVQEFLRARGDQKTHPWALFVWAYPEGETFGHAQPLNPMGELVLRCLNFHDQQGFGGKVMKAVREQLTSGGWVDVITFDTGNVAIVTDDHYLFGWDSREAWDAGVPAHIVFALC